MIHVIRAVRLQSQPCLRLEWNSSIRREKTGVRFQRARVESTAKGESLGRGRWRDKSSLRRPQVFFFLLFSLFYFFQKRNKHSFRLVFPWIWKKKICTDFDFFFFCFSCEISDLALAIHSVIPPHLTYFISTALSSSPPTIKILIS